MHQAGDLAFRAFYAHSSGQRVFTDAPIAQAVRAQHPGQPLHIVPTAAVDGGGDLLAFALAGHARAEPAADAALEGQQPLEYRVYVPDPKRVGGGPGAFATRVALGKYVYTWREREYVVYVVSGRDGTEPYGKLDRQFIVGGHEHGHAVDELVRAVSLWTAEVRDAVLVFDHGYWQPSRELYAAVRRASWDDVILDEEMKRGIQNDVLRFFDAEERYRKLRVPWRRGEIYYGACYLFVWIGHGHARGRAGRRKLMGGGRRSAWEWEDGVAQGIDEHAVLTQRPDTDALRAHALIASCPSSCPALRASRGARG